MNAFVLLNCQYNVKSVIVGESGIVMQIKQLNITFIAFIREEHHKLVVQLFYLHLAGFSTRNLQNMNDNHCKQLSIRRRLVSPQCDSRLCLPPLDDRTIADRPTNVPGFILITGTYLIVGSLSKTTHNHEGEERKPPSHGLLDYDQLYGSQETSRTANSIYLLVTLITVMPG